MGKRRVVGGRLEMGLGPGLVEASRTLLGLNFPSNGERASNGGFRVGEHGIEHSR